MRCVGRRFQSRGGLGLNLMLLQGASRRSSVFWPPISPPRIPLTHFPPGSQQYAEFLQHALPPADYRALLPSMEVGLAGWRGVGPGFWDIGC